MLGISFKTWDNAAYRFFCWKRYRIGGWRWTPFIVGRRRYKS